MRNASNETSILLSSAVDIGATHSRRSAVHPKVDDKVEGRDERVERLAKEFVRWCFSFGSDFRNSPDVTNLRVWCRKTKTKLKSAEEDAVLAEAQQVFAGKLRQVLRKVNATIPENDNTILE